MAAKYPEKISTEAEDNSLIQQPSQQLPATVTTCPEYESNIPDFYDVFLVHAEENKEWMEKIQSELNTIVLSSGRNMTTESVGSITPGMSIFDGFVEYIKKSNFVFVMITKDFEACEFAKHLKSEALYEQLQNETAKFVVVPVYLEKVSYRPTGIKSIAPVFLYQGGIKDLSLTTKGKEEFRNLSESVTRTKFNVDIRKDYKKGEGIGKETQWCEFKERKEKKLTTVVQQYATAFLNTEGGILYFGVTDEGIVQGIRLNVDECARHIVAAQNGITPRVNKSLFHIHFVPVLGLKDRGYVIRITVAEGYAKPYKYVSGNETHVYVRNETRNDRVPNDEVTEYFIKNSSARLYEHFERPVDFMDNLAQTEPNHAQTQPNGEPVINEMLLCRLL